MPVHVAAKIAALCEMYPNRSRTEIVGDLLSSALESVQAGFPSIKGRPFGIDPDTNEQLFEDVGPINDFIKLTNRHYVEFERELGNETPSPFFTFTPIMVEGD